MLTKPTITGARLILRPIETTDLDAYFALLQDAESLRLTGTLARFSREQIARWIATIAEADDRIDLAIVLRDTNELIGEIVLNDFDDTHRCANLRVGLRTAYTDRGYGSEALRLMIAHAFERVELHRLELEVYSFNPRALHVYTKLGFQQEGRRRDALFFEGAYHDSIGMSVLEDEYRGRK
ncbi:MAG: GNAT family N-acetyltransferase [Chloroflexales bacterium]|nr:GNAT family N-acetyltransferase [Chloroflexales bacterium]